jgi:HlyD family secretion protein
MNAMAASRSYRILGRRIFGGLLVVGIAGMLFLALRPQPIPVDLAEATRGELEVTVHEDGRAQVKDRYTISAPLNGRLARVELEPGDPIEEGAAVAYLLPVAPALLDARSREQAEARVAAARAGEARARAAIDRAEAAQDLARSEALRQETLLEQGGVAERARDRAVFERRAAEQELASARFSARVATHEVRMAQAALGTMNGRGQGALEQFAITSPVTGRVLRVLERSEGVVQAGRPILEVGDPSVLEAVVDVLTTDATAVTPGNPARIVHWGGEGALSARVRLKEPSAFTRTSALGVEEQRVNVVLDLIDPYERWASLGDGYRVEADIIVDRAEDVVRVPPGAIFRHRDGWAVFRVRDGFARLAPVDIGRRADAAVEITSGLDEGDAVVLHPSDRVVDGASVEAR